MSPLVRSFRLSGIRAFLLIAAPIAFFPSRSQAVDIFQSTVTPTAVAPGQGISYEFKLRGTVAVQNAAGTAYLGESYRFIVFLVGTDFYGNTVYPVYDSGVTPELFGERSLPIPLPAGTTPVLAAPTEFTVAGTLQVPDDGTLHRFPATSYRVEIRLYGSPTLPPTGQIVPTPLPVDFDTFNVSQSFGPISIERLPDLEIATPGVVYTAGSYRGGDIIQFKTSWLNRAPNESRPLRSNEIYAFDVRLTTDAEYGGTANAEDGRPANDDFRLVRQRMSGDLPLAPSRDIAGGEEARVPDGTTVYRRIDVPPLPALPTYGIPDTIIQQPGADTTLREYTPQPDDGYLDLGEEVGVSNEVIVPENYMGRYFVAAMVDADENIPEQGETAAALDPYDAGVFANVFVSNAANKIEILETASAQVEPASAISDQNGIFLQGGRGASDFGSSSEDGNLAAFSSVANNLLVPPNLARIFTIGAGPEADMSDYNLYPVSAPGQPILNYSDVEPYLTSGRQVFLKYRQTREVQLISRTGSGDEANADTFNPAISANGRYVAYDSAATNLSGEPTGNRSMIYVVDTETFTTVIVSRNTRGQLANGSSFNPSVSQSGRFVVFESIATNLELPEFTANIDPVTQRVTGFTRVRAGVGYSSGSLPAVTISGGGGAGATARANVNSRGQITSLTLVSAGGGYVSAPSVSIAAPTQMHPSTAGQGQVYLHDRDVDGNGVFDEPASGKTATYLVSVADTGAVADNLSYAPVVNLEDSAEDLQENGGMYVAFASYGQNMEMANGNAAMIYRTLVDVSKDTPAGQRGPILTEVVSLNDAGDLPLGSVPLGIVGYSVQPTINGDGSQVAFTSNALNLVYDSETEAFDGDTNLVQDVFVRNFRKPLGVPGNGAVARISVSQERVATGTIVFSVPAWTNLPMPGGTPFSNIPDNQPSPGDSITLNDGLTSQIFTFGLAPGPGTVVIGSSVLETRNNLIGAINSSGLNIEAVATTPPTPPDGTTAYNAAIYVKNRVPGSEGNKEIAVNSPSGKLVADGMSGGGTQAEDAPAAVQGVPFGSSQPSIDRSGRFVAFRSIAENLDVHIATDDNTYPVVPPEGGLITGELIRPLIFPTSNVYLRDRLADGNEEAGFDRPASVVDDVLREYTATTRISLNKFGYPTSIERSQVSGVNANTSANSSSPSLSADGRFIAFSSDSEGTGGLIFGPNNLSPGDTQKFRDVFIFDRLTPGANPPSPTTKPTVSILSPGDGLTVTPGTEISINVSARASAGKSITSVAVYVNNSLIPQTPGGVAAAVTAEPFTWTYVLNTTGDYTIRAVATDNKGLTNEAFVRVRAEPLGAGAPSVVMTQPSSVFRFVTGSSYFLNARARAQSPATIRPESLKFLVNELETSLPIGRLGDTYGVLYEPTTPFTVDTYRARATDTSNRAALSGPLFSVLTLAQRLLPEVDMVQFSPATRVNAGELVTLQADALFPADANDQARVEFYVNNVFVGVGTAGAVTPAGRTRFSFIWQVPDLKPGDPVPNTYEVRARAVALNFFFVDDNDNRTEFFGSVVSDLEPLPVYGVPLGEDPTTNRGFVSSVHRKLFYEQPTYEVWNSYVSALDAGQITRAQVLMGLMGFNSTTSTFGRNTLYGRTSAVPLIAFGRFPLLTPTTQDVTNFISLMDNNILPLPIAAPYSGLAGSPWGATFGMAAGMQQVIFNTGQFRIFYGRQNDTNDEFLTWLTTTVFAGRSPGQQILRVRDMMDTIAPPAIAQGSAMAFLSELALVENNATEQAFQRQIHSTALNFQLNGFWSIAYGKSNPYSLAAVQGILAAGAKPQISNNSAAATATVNLATAKIDSVTITNAGYGYTSPPALTISAPTATTGATTQATAATTTLAGATSLNVVQIMVTNGGSGYTSAPAVTIAPPAAGGTPATATANVQAGVVKSITVNTRGSGYVSVPAVTIAAPASGTQAAATALCGVPTARLVNAGAGYGTTATATVAPPTGAMFASGNVGQDFTFQLTANNNAEYFYATGLPDGLALDTATGVITGIPTTAGIYPVSVSASNWAGQGTARTFNITVFPQAPTITSLSSVRGTANFDYTQAAPLYTVTVTPDNVVTTFEVVGLPNNLRTEPKSGAVPPYSGVIVGRALSAGSTKVLIRATNAGGITEKELTVNMVASTTTTAMRTYLSGFGVTNQTASADPDGDGHSNAVEFAFGMNPTTRDVPLEIRMIENGAKVRLSWNQRLNEPGIQYSIIGASQLSTTQWRNATDDAGLQATRSETAASQSGYRRHTVELPVSTEGTRKFYRAKATIDPALLGP